MMTFNPAVEARPPPAAPHQHVRQHRMNKRKKLIIGAALSLLVIVVAVSFLAVPKDSGEAIHVVAAGDTVNRICAIHGVRVSDVLKANAGLDPRRLRVGQTVVIPPPPAMVRLGRRMDELTKKIGIKNPPFTSIARSWTDEDSKK